MEDDCAIAFCCSCCSSSTSPDQRSIEWPDWLAGWFPRTKMIYRASVCFSIQATKIN